MCGCFTYNGKPGALEEALEDGKPIPDAKQRTGIELPEAGDAPWWAEVFKCASQEAFRNLKKAIRDWRRS